MSKLSFIHGFPIPNWPSEILNKFEGRPLWHSVQAVGIGNIKTSSLNCSRAVKAAERLDIFGPSTCREISNQCNIE